MTRGDIYIMVKYLLILTLVGGGNGGGVAIHTVPTVYTDKTVCESIGQTWQTQIKDDLRYYGVGSSYLCTVKSDE